MAFRIGLVQDTVQRIVPARFAKDVSGLPQPGRYELDDCGYAPQTDKGPITTISFWADPPPGLSTTPRIHVKVIRDRLNPSTPLHATVENSSGSSLIRLIQSGPFTGPTVGLKDTIALEASPSLGGQPTTDVDHRYGMACIEIRHGTPTGPILARFKVLVLEGKTVPVHIYKVRLNGQDLVRNESSMRQVVHNANLILIQAGVQLQVQEISRVDLTHPNENTLTAGVIVATPVSFPTETSVYWVKQVGERVGDGTPGSMAMGEALGPGLSRGPGIPNFLIIWDEQGGRLSEVKLARTLAHEFCHMMRLGHFGQSRVMTGLPVVEGEGRHRLTREDVWAHRNLMYWCTDLPKDRTYWESMNQILERSHRSDGAVAGLFFREGGFWPTYPRRLIDCGSYFAMSALAAEETLAPGTVLTIREPSVTGIVGSAQVSRLRAAVFRGEWRPWYGQSRT